MSARTVVPLPFSEVMVTSPPTARARSRMTLSPMWPARASDSTRVTSNPWPSSLTSIVATVPAVAKRMSTRWAPACWRMLARACWAIR